MAERKNLTEDRKIDHIKLAVSQDVEFKRKTTLLECVEFIHMPIPELNLNEILISTEFLTKKISAPIMIAGMTGGTREAYKLNKIMAKAAQRLNIPMGVGSQRAMLENSSLIDSYKVVRTNAPDIPIIANIGVSQIIRDIGKNQIEKIINVLNADALAIHLNPLQEAVQPEGEPFYAGFIEKLARIIDNLEIPLILKETGAGFSKESAEMIKDLDIYAIDIGGAGGTSFSKIEALRAKNEYIKHHVAKTFEEWGIPTAASILEVKTILGNKVRVIATGGIRDGLMAAKALRLGADLVGYALPVIRAAYYGGEEAVYNLLSRYIMEIKVALFLTGSRNINDLRSKPIVITGRLKDWIEQRKLLLS